MLSSCLAYRIRAHVCYTCTWGFKFKYLWATGVTLLFNKLTGSIIPHYSTAIPVQKDANELWQRAQENVLEAQEEMSCFSLQPWFHSFSMNCLGAYLDRALPAAMARSTQELNLARSGACWGNWGWGGAGRELLWCWPAVPRALRDFRWPDPPLLQALCLSWCQMPCDCKDHRFTWGETVGQILATEIHHQNSNSLLIPAEFLKKNSNSLYV